MNYHLFAGDTYYAKGGALDYQVSSNSIEALVKYFNEKEEEKHWTWFHITDENLKIVRAQGEAQH